MRVAAEVQVHEIIARTSGCGASKDRSIAAIRAIGAQHFVVASDAGLTGDLSHTDALALAAKTLRAAGFSEADLTTMNKDNPAFLVRLPPLGAAK